MYFSVIRNNRPVIIVADGVAEAEILELPTEELADQVAYQLQLAWNEGQIWGEETLKRELDPVGHSKLISDAILELKSMSDEKKKAKSIIETNRIHEQNKKVMKQVLSRKTREKSDRQ